LLFVPEVRVDVHIGQTGQKIFTGASHDDAVGWPMPSRLMLLHATNGAALDEYVPMWQGLLFVHWNYGYVFEDQCARRLTKARLGTDEQREREHDEECPHVPSGEDSVHS
jgi:hypothetical protein